MRVPLSWLREYVDIAVPATELAALIWYFEDRLGREIPTDLETYARSTGFADAASFRRAVWREHVYSRFLGARRRPRRGVAG